MNNFRTIVSFCAATLIAASNLYASEQVLAVNHNGMLCFASAVKGEKSELALKDIAFSLSYYHEVADWRWDPAVSQDYDRKVWPTKQPSGSQTTDGYIYNGRIGRCPYSLKISNPRPGLIEAEYTVDAVLSPKPDNEELELKTTSARGLLLRIAPDCKIPESVFGQNGSSVPADFEIKGMKFKLSLENSTVKRSYRIKQGNDKINYVRAFDLGFKDNSIITIKYKLEYPAEIPFIGNNKRFASFSDQTGWYEVAVNHKICPVDISSSVLDAPAGKYGFMYAENGHFYFKKRPGIPVYLSGVTLVHNSKFPEKDVAEDFASRIAGMGCNIVRLHHLDYFLPGFGIFDRKDMESGKTGRIDAELIDRMDYLIFCLKQKGIYIHLDGITARRLLPGDGIKDGEKLSFGFKGSAYLYEDQALMKVQKDYISTLWNHVNPYTKLAYKDDPAIVSSSILNENDIYLHGSLNHHFPGHFSELYKKMYKDWCDSPEGISFADEAKFRREDIFRKEIISKYFSQMMDLFKELNPVRPVCGTTWIHPQRLQLLAAYGKTDFTADHPYRDGLINQDELNIGKAGFKHFAPLSLAKRFDQPLMHEEWNSIGSDRAGTMGLSMAMMTVLGHDMNMLFALHHHFEKGLISPDVISLNIGYDPARSFILPAMNLAFIRRDFKENPQVYYYLLDDEILFGKGPQSLFEKKFEEIYPSYAGASFFGRCAFVFSEAAIKKVQAENPSAIIVRPGAEPSFDYSTYPLKSGSGEIELYWRDAYVLGKSSKTKFAFGNWGEKAALELGDAISIRSGNGKYIDFTLSSLDGSELKKSTHMMLVFSGRIELENLYYDQNGKNPVAPSTKVLAEPLRGSLCLPTSFKNVKAFWKESSGAKGGELKTEKTSSGWLIYLNAKSSVFELITE